jgi:hypothetical protein
MVVTSTNETTAESYGKYKHVEHTEYYARYDENKYITLKCSAINYLLFTGKCEFNLKKTL